MQAKHLKWRRWTREIRPMIALALPIMAGMVAQMLMGVADTIMVGRVGVVPLAAASFVNVISHPLVVFSIGLLSAVSILAAQAYGAKRKNDAAEVFRHGLAVAGGAGLLLALTVLWLSRHLGIFGQPPEVIEASRAYFVLIGWSMLPALIAQVAKQYSESLGHPWMPTIIMLAAVALNVGLNWLWIYGHWGFPAGGLTGAGWATLAARVVMAALLVACVITHAPIRDYLPKQWFRGLSLARLRELLRLGGPVGAQHLLEVSAFAFAGLMMGWISADALAAHQVAITCAATSFMFALGLGMAVSIRVGQAWGAVQPRRMRRIGLLGIALGGGIMALFAIVFAVAREPIAGLFVTAPAVIALTAQLLIIAAIFQVMDGLQVTALLALRGLSDVRVPALVAGLAYWLVAVPAAYVFGFPLNFGAAGIWAALAIGLAVAAAALAWRFHLRTRASPEAARTVSPETSFEAVTTPSASGS